MGQYLAVLAGIEELDEGHEVVGSLGRGGAREHVAPRSGVREIEDRPAMYAFGSAFHAVGLVQDDLSARGGDEVADAVVVAGNAVVVRHQDVGCAGDVRVGAAVDH